MVDKADWENLSEHIWYEMTMVLAVADELQAFVHKSVIRNALIESFSIHARVLVDFFYGSKDRPDDIVASEFYSDPLEWKKLRPRKTQSLEIVSQRVGKEIAHLSSDRVRLTEQQKDWPYQQIALDLKNVIEKFIESSPNELWLGEDFKFTD